MDNKLVRLVRSDTVDAQLQKVLMMRCERSGDIR